MSNFELVKDPDRKRLLEIDAALEEAWEDERICFPEKYPEVANLLAEKDDLIRRLRWEGVPSTASDADSAEDAGWLKLVWERIVRFLRISDSAWSSTPLMNTVERFLRKRPDLLALFSLEAARVKGRRGKRARLIEMEQNKELSKKIIRELNESLSRTQGGE